MPVSRSRPLFAGAVAKSSGSAGERGNSIVEFALVISFLVPLLAGSFSIGISLARAIQVSNVCRDTNILFLRSVTDPAAALDLSKASNQSIVIRSAQGLGMNMPNTNNPDPNGLGLVVLSKVILVGDTECQKGVVPAPGGAPPWNTGNCPNYGQYVFGSRISIGNTSKFASVFGNPPAAIVRTDGTIADSDIAQNSANRISNFSSILTMTPGSFGLVSEMFVDISYLNLFSIMPTPIIYSRNIS